MMKKQNKKRGFTIVELTIVVSVIAILSAVLIPTFAAIIKRSKISADEQAVRNMNTVLATIVEDDIDYNDIAAALGEAGFNVSNKNDAWNPLYTKYSAYWVADRNTIVLVEDDQVVYPTYMAGALPATAIALKASNYVATSTATTANEVVKDIKAAINNGQSITLSNEISDLTVNTIQVDEGNEITIDLGGNTLTGNVKNANDTDGQPRSHYALDNYGDLTIKNGTISSRGIENFKGATLTLGEGVTVEAVDSNGGACIWNAGGELIIQGGTYIATAGDKGDTTDTIASEPGIINNRDGGTVVINGGTFKAENTGCYAIQSNSGSLKITGGMFTAFRGCVSVTGGTCEISGGTFEQLEQTSGHVLHTTSNASITMTAGKLIGYSLFSGNVNLDSAVEQVQK